MSDKIWNPKLALDKFYPDIRVEFEEELQLVWLYMKANPRQCFTLDMIKSIKTCIEEIKRNQAVEVDFIVFASDMPGVFNLGGDLNLFYQSIIDNNREVLFQYGYSCIESQYETMIHLGLDLTTISLVQGKALGGGFEGALSTNLFIAEEGSLVGFPEVLFNLFPGMGAYNFLSARIAPLCAEKIMLVDDDQMVADVAKGMLSLLGYSVKVFTDSVEALETFVSNPKAFDLVITDQIMPNMTGDELVKEILSLRHDIPVVMATGYSNKITEAKAKELGAKQFLMKPFKIDALASAVRDCLCTTA